MNAVRTALPHVPARPLDRASLTALASAVARDRSCWEPRLRLPSGAERWWLLLHSWERADVWLLSWLPGHATDLHDHGGSAAAFAVLRGELAEVRAPRRGREQTRVLRAPATAWVEPGAVHDVRATSAGPAVSIHAYSPPLSRMTFFQRDGAGELRAVRRVESREPELATG